jgi:hypothetical protein
LGQRFAELIQQPHAHQLGVCAKLRISYASYKRWMAADLDAEGVKQDLVDFQCTVMEALEGVRVAELESIKQELDDLDGPGVAKAGAYVNVHTFHHENRFRRFYANDDEPKRAEIDLGNKGGTPFKTSNKHGLTEATRRALVTGVLGVTDEMLDAGDEAGRLDTGDENDL